MEQALLIVLRAVHILSGVYWAGSVIIGAAVSMPLLRGAGPEGERLMKALVESPRSVAFFAGSSLLTVVSGLLLFWLVYGFAGPWSSTQWAFAIGGLSAILSPALGSFIGRLVGPRGTKELAADEVRLRGMAVLLSLTVVLMATARYLY